MRKNWLVGWVYYNPGDVEPTPCTCRPGIPWLQVKVSHHGMSRQASRVLPERISPNVALALAYTFLTWSKVAQPMKATLTDCKISLNSSTASYHKAALPLAWVE